MLRVSIEIIDIIDFIKSFSCLILLQILHKLRNDECLEELDDDDDSYTRNRIHSVF